MTNTTSPIHPASTNDVLTSAYAFAGKTLLVIDDETTNASPVEHQYAEQIAAVEKEIFDITLQIGARTAKLFEFRGLAADSFGPQLGAQLDSLIARREVMWGFLIGAVTA